MSSDTAARRVDVGARRRVVHHLSSVGSVFDASGRAVAQLREAVGYQASEAGFAQLLAAMDKAGEIRREIRGKRTYRIALGPQADATTLVVSAEVAPASDAGDQLADPGGLASQSDQADLLDYDELALALLRAAARNVQLERPRAGTAPNAPGDAPISLPRAQRRIAVLERQQTELEREVARANAERSRLAATQADLERQLEAATRTIETLHSQLERRSTRRSTAQRLDAEEMSVLRQLVRDRPGARGRGASAAG